MKNTSIATNHRANSIIDPLTNPADFLCIMLGSTGFSNKLIKEKTHLTSNQITFRLKKYGVSRRAYRDGRTAIARMVVENAQKKLTSRIRGEIRDGGKILLAKESKGVVIDI